MDRIITWASSKNIKQMNSTPSIQEAPYSCELEKQMTCCKDSEEQGSPAQNISVGMILNNIREKSLWENGTLFSLSRNKEYFNVIPFIGIHPWDTAEADEETINSLKEISSRTGAFIGEFGFDKLKGADKEKQLYLFKKCLEIALKSEKPFTIHCVRSWGLLEEELQKVKNRIKAPFIVHAYNGSAEVMKTITELGGYPSFGLERYGAFSRKAADSILKIDLKYLLFETDFTCYLKQPTSSFRSDDDGENSINVAHAYPVMPSKDCENREHPVMPANDRENSKHHVIPTKAGISLSHTEDNYYGEKYLKRLFAVYNEAASILKIDITELSGAIEENGKIFKAYTINRK
ncbi:MAG: TatD family hydrolase [Spirochaetaceae bacterium]|nr:TatD family hydrolase [Spirochaetaceae bacterium]